VKGWCEEVIQAILRELAKDQFQPFKYRVNCLVLSTRSNGVHTVTMSLWDPQSDGSVTEQWSNDSMQCIVTVWGLKY
jgi:dynein light chain Tctex-type 1